MPVNELRRGSLADWESPTVTTDSMARAIEDALQDNFGPFPPADPADRRKFCLAISHGVLNYLRDHAQSFRVTVDDGAGGTFSGRVASITVR